MKAFEIFRGLKEKLGTKKGGTILFTIGIVGILLIYFSSMSRGQNNNKTPASGSGTMTAEEYCTSLETKVQTLVEKITGDSEPVVIITLDSGTKYVYADQTKNNTDKSENKKDDGAIATEQSDKTEQSYIIVKTEDGGEKALLVTELMPGIRGVAIVSSGIDAVTEEQVKQSVMAVLNISSRKIYVSGKNS